MSLITIEQLLESVGLEFEPRWVTKDKIGLIGLWEEKPTKFKSSWFNSGWQTKIGCLKLSEFDGKDWTECIYEVPRKTTGKIEKIEVGYNNSLKAQDWQDIAHTVANKINELVNAVNELKGHKE